MLDKRDFFRYGFPARTLRFAGGISRRAVFSLIWNLVIFSIIISAQYHFDEWTTDNGLPQNTARAILQTSDGYIWFTTLDGLVRFDGVRFTVFNKSNSKNVPGNRFINLFAEADDTLWICTEEQGVVRYRNGEFRTFTIADGLPSNSVIEISRALDGTLTAIARNGISRFDGTRFAAIENEFDTEKIKRYAAPSGTIWELDKNRLIAAKDGITRTFDLPENLKNALADESNLYLWTSLFEDSQNRLWIARKKNLAFSEARLFKFSNESFAEIKLENAPQSLILNMEEDRNGNLWLATQRDGACRLSENKMICLTPENGFPDRFVRDVFRDREGSLWFATEEKGIYRLIEQAISPVSTAQGLAEKNVYAILEDRAGAVWIGSLGGLARYKDAQITNFKSADNLKYTDVQTLFEDRDNRLWIGSLNGLASYENGKFVDQKDKIAPLEKLAPFIGEPAFYDIYQDRNGILWFATNYGLLRYDGAQTAVLNVADGLPGNNVKAILENEDGSFWLGTYDGIALFKDGKFAAYTEKDGLAGNHVRTLYKDDAGVLWIGTYESGLSRFKDGKFTNYTMENGLASNGAFQILEDAGKNFWISSNQGIYRVARKQLEEFAAGERAVVTSTLFGKTDGMASSEANGGGSPAGIKAKDGRLWFPTQNGVAVIDTEKVRANPLPPPVVIEKTRVDNKILATAAEITIQPDQDTLEIDYTGLSFIKPEQVRFRYRLEGLDENWTEAGNRRTAVYSHLAPGEYTFRVIAANSDNVWNETGAQIRIRKIPPFYRTWWFFAVVLAAFGSIVYGLYRMRVSRLEKARLVQEEFSRRLIRAHETERRRIAAELHDSIGQSLAMIKNRVILSAGNANEENLRQELGLIVDQTTETIGEVREISYNLRPYLLDNLGFTRAVRSFLNKIEKTTDLRVEYEFDGVDRLFDAEAEMSLYRIIQETISNVIKHADATEIQVLIKKREQNLSLMIADDGRGFDLDSLTAREIGSGGFGLVGIKERVRLLGGTQEIETGVGKGTIIFIKIPFDKSHREKKQ